MTVPIAETAIYTVLLSQALLEILEEKGLITRAEVTARMKKLESETKGRMRRFNDHKPNLASSTVLSLRLPYLSRIDIDALSWCRDFVIPPWNDVARWKKFGWRTQWTRTT